MHTRPQELVIRYVKYPGFLGGSGAPSQAAIPTPLDGGRIPRNLHAQGQYWSHSMQCFSGGQIRQENPGKLPRVAAICGAVYAHESAFLESLDNDPILRRPKVYAGNSGRVEEGVRRCSQRRRGSPIGLAFQLP